MSTLTMDPQCVSSPSASSSEMPWFAGNRSQISYRLAFVAEDSCARGRDLDACGSSRDRSLSASTAALSEVEFPLDFAWGSDAEDSDDDNAAIQEAIYEASSPKRGTLSARKPRWADLEDSEESSPENKNSRSQTRPRCASFFEGSSSGQGEDLPQVAATTTTSLAAAFAASETASTADPEEENIAAVAVSQEADVGKPRRKQRGNRGGASHKAKKEAAEKEAACVQQDTQGASWDQHETQDRSWDQQETQDRSWDKNATWDNNSTKWSSWNQWKDEGRNGSWLNSNGRGGKQNWQSWSASRDGSSGAAWKQQVPETTKQQCQFIVGIEDDTKFRVVRRLLGSHGAHVKRIAEGSGAKLRLRGRGSKFLEGLEQEESSDPLMMCVSSPDKTSHAEAVRLVREHLEQIYSEYREYCEKKGLTIEDLCLDMHEGKRDGSY